MNQLCRTEFGQEFRFGRAPGRGHDTIAECREQRDGDASDATVGASDEHIAGVRLDSVALERQNAQHRCIARRPDGHGLSRGELLRQGDEPVSLDARLLRQTAGVRFPHAPTVEHDAITGLVPRVITGFDHAGKIDSGMKGELAYHRRAASDGQPVLEVDRGVFDTDSYLARRQCAVVHIFHDGAVAVGIFVNDDGFEHMSQAF
ncbi:hypothetical protein D3C85_1051180 [compost metagenome]